MNRHRLFLTLLLLLLIGCTRFDLLNAVSLPVGSSRTAGLVYGPQPRQRLDVYRPTHALPSGDVVVFFYGGDWQHGSRRDYRFVGRALASQGFVAVLPDYRLYPAVTFPAFLNDGAAAVRWTHDNIHRFGGNPGRVFLMGHSAGAYIAVMLALDPEYFAREGLTEAVVRGADGLSGPYDFLPPADDKPVFNLSKIATTMPEGEKPIHFAAAAAPPMLLQQGLKDRTVGSENTAHLAAALRRCGAPVQVIFYPDRAHVGVALALAGPFHWLAPVLHDSTAFFRSH